MIKLYFAKITDFTQADYTKMYSLLECAIREKIDAKKQTSDKQRSLVGYILLYRAVHEIYGKTGFEIYFNQHGKPLCNFCYFSISHSEQAVFCVISDKPVGADIQKIKHIKQRGRYRFFNAKENDYVNQNIALISKRYIEIFAKKEAAVKLLGKSLAYADFIDTFSEKNCFDVQYKDDFVLVICTNVK